MTRQASGPARYLYPDPGDAILNHFLRQMEPGYLAYYRASERAILERARRQLAEGGGGASLLDLGTGVGRLLPIFAPEFRRTTALEPDASRISAARALARAQRLGGVSFVHGDLEDLPKDAQFDAVLCCHVIQHVHTSRVPVILSRIRALLRPGGRVALLASHSTVGIPLFNVTFAGGAEPVNQQVPEKVFNQFAARGNPTILVSQHFTRQRIVDLVLDAGLRPLEFRTYRVDDIRYAGLGLDRIDKLDDYVNADPHRQDGLGLDLCLLAERAA